MKREALVDDRRHGARGNKQGEKGRESFRSHGQKELRPYPATASGREGLRRVALTPCCLVIQTKKLADSNRAKNAQSIGLTFGFSSRPRSGISCAAEE